MIRVARLAVLVAAFVSAAPLCADPAAAVRELLAHSVAGDLPDQPFLDAHRRRIQARCAQLVSLRTEIVSADDETAAVETEETYLLDAARLVTAHSRFALRRDGGEWGVVAWDSRETAFAEQLAAAALADRAALVAASPELHTLPLVRALARRTIDDINANQLEDAVSLVEIASGVAADLGDPAALAEALAARSVVVRYRNAADIPLAIELAREAVDLAAASGDRDAHGSALLRLSRAKENLDGGIDAEPLRAFLHQFGDRVESAALLALLATGVTRELNEAGALREAVRYAEMAARFADESGDAAAQISAELLLGGAYTTYGGAGDLALRHFRRAAERSLAAGFESAAAGSLASIAAAQNGVGLVDEATATVDAALGALTAPLARGQLLAMRAWIHTSAGRLDAAERDLQEAFALAPMQRPQLEARLADLRFRQGRLDEALALAERVGAASPNLQMRGIRAMIMRCWNRPEEALRLIEEMDADVEAQPSAVADPQRLLFAGGDAAAHGALWVNILVEQGRLGMALNVDERMKAAMLRKAVATGRGRAGFDRPAEHEAEQTLTVRVASLNRSLLAARNATEIASLRERLTEARRELVDFRQRKLALLPADVPPAMEIDIDRLPPRLDNVTIVSYAPTDEGTTIFVIGPKTNGRRRLTVRIAPIGTLPLSRLAKRFASLLSERNLRVDAFGAELYELLLRPIEGELGTGPLCIVPDHDLWYVPFHVLKPKDGERVIDRWAVFYAPSISVLALAESKREQRPARERPAVLAFANPQLGAETVSLYRAFDPSALLGALPEAETEVRAIGRIYGPAHSTIRIGAEAREALLKRDASRYDVLHVATHGLVSGDAPMFSALVLSASPGEAGDDGLLEAREIALLDLDIDLAVFSACDTGKSTSGGVLGFAWALFAAGCPTTVVSQWHAQSASTARLMIEFHRQLVAGASKPEALRRAQAKVRGDRKYAHPFYWAPFMIVGAP